MSSRQTGISAVLSLLDYFSANSPELSLTEFCTKTGFPKANTIRYLNALQQAGLVKKDERTKKYSIGYKVYELFYISSQTMSLGKIAYQYMEQCSKISLETVVLFVENGIEGSVCIECIDSQNVVRYHPPIGVNTPYYAGASSKVLLSHMTEDRINSILSKPLKKVGLKTITDREVLKKQLAEIRKCGYAISVSENNNGVRGIAVPVWSKNAVIGSLCIGGPESSFTEDKAMKLLPLLKEMSANISKDVLLSKEQIRNL